MLMLSVMSDDNFLTDETNVLRTQYHISHQPESEYNAVLSWNDKKVFIHKEFRKTNNHKITHSNVVSLVRVVAFNYMGFKCDNLESILQKAKAHLLLSTIGRVCVVAKPGFGVLHGDGTVEQCTIVAYQEEDDDDLPLLDDLKSADELWPYGVPDLNRLDEINDRFFSLSGNLSLPHFVEFVNHFFQSHNLATLIQNPLSVVFEELNSKYGLYKMHNNIQILACSLFPSIYDFFTTQCIVNRIEVCHSHRSAI